MGAQNAPPRPARIDRELSVSQADHAAEGLLLLTGFSEDLLSTPVHGDLETTEPRRQALPLRQLRRQ